MREIKFRVWDKKKKKMYLVAGIDFALEKVEIWVETLKDKVGITSKMREFSDVELMQYTGLKDKNGVEVYQGDIVRCTRGCPHEVIWLEEYGGTFVGGMPAWYLSGLMEGYAWTGEEEVLGNIYANPELLKESGTNE